MNLDTMVRADLCSSRGTRRRGLALILAGLVVGVTPTGTVGQPSSPAPSPSPATAVPYDFGDAPDPSFPSLLASDGARTVDPSQFWLGDQTTAGASVEPDARTIDLDDADDGLVRVLATAGSIAVTFAATRSPTAPRGTAWFNLLADSNGDGRWGATLPDAPSEWVAVNMPIEAEPGATTFIDANVPLVGGNLAPWLRASLTDTPVTGGDWDGTGAFAQGEVEDHLIQPGDLWDAWCEPDPLRIPHGDTRAIDPVDDPPFTAAEMRVDGVSGEQALLGDPGAADITVAPAVDPDWVPLGQISVTSDRKHSFPEEVVVTYELSLSVRGAVGVKTFSCTVEVVHEAEPGVPARRILEVPGGQIAYLGSLEVKRRGRLEATFQVVSGDGSPA